MEGEETLTLAVCNKVSRDIKLAKVFIDHTLEGVSASCEFFYTDMESLKNNVEHVQASLAWCVLHITRQKLNSRTDFLSTFIFLSKKSLTLPSDCVS